MDHKTLPFVLGETLPYTNRAGQTLNTDLLGVPFIYPSQNLPADARFAHVRRSGYPLRVVILKNDSAATLKGSRIGQLDVAEASVQALHKCVGYANTLGAAHPVIIDEFLGSSGVAAGDYFYGILDGPVKVALPGDYNDMGGNWTAGDWLYSAPSGTTAVDDDAGRAAKIASGSVVLQVNATPTPDEVTVDYSVALNAALNAIGWTMESVTAGDPVESSLVLIKASIRL